MDNRGLFALLEGSYPRPRFQRQGKDLLKVTLGTTPIPRVAA
jgi:hypothetical protein